VVCTGLTVYGMALVYGVTGSLQVNAVADALAEVRSAGGPRATLAAAAVVLVLVGFAFKVSAVPFHFWVPDTYQGAPVPVAAFLSTASKAAGVAGLLIVLLDAFPPYADVWGVVVAVMAALTMTVGNLVALRQWHMVRLLAWSTVAQAGYLLVPLGVAATASGRTSGELHDAAAATLTYLAIYVVMNLGAFAVVHAVVRQRPRGAIEDFRGLASRSPALAVALGFFLAALAGLPPGVAGLVAKVVVLREAVHGDVTWLAVVAAVNTVIGLAYYLRVAALMFTTRRPPHPRLCGVPSCRDLHACLPRRGLRAARLRSCGHLRPAGRHRHRGVDGRDGTG
jgi:NADH-quinone oxidoreductase subunit N